MKPAPFVYHRPRALDEALSLLAGHGGEAKALAGGQSLQDYAALRAVSLNAVRFLLKGIFRKTGVTSQAQLVAMVARLPSPTI